MTYDPSDGGHQGAAALHSGMDATTAPHRIPPEMPQYGEANHIFEMMQVTRAPPPCRDTRRRQGNLLSGSGCTQVTPHQEGSRLLPTRPPKLGC